MGIYLKTEDEIELIRQANLLVSRTLGELSRHIRPGVTTARLDAIAEEFIRDHGGVPTFKGFPSPFADPFPASICTSVNAVVVHGIPSAGETLRDGDIISIDCGAELNGFCGDSCYTFCVGEVVDDVRALLKVTKESLYKGIEAACAGRHVGDIGHAVQSHCESAGYGVVRELTGHGIGRKMHEEPQVPNYGRPGTGEMLKAGMCLAIEPMVTMGNRAIGLMADRWGFRTRDGLCAAHFEHTVAIRRGRAEILSTFDDIESQQANQQ